MYAHPSIHIVFTVHKHSRVKILFLLNMVFKETFQIFRLKSKNFMSISIDLNWSLVLVYVLRILIVIRKWKRR